MNKAQEITSVAALLCRWGIGPSAARAAAVKVVSNGAVDIDPIFFDSEEGTTTATSAVELEYKKPLSKVNRGIYIDMGCNGIHQVDEWIFIPTGYGSAESNKKFQEELNVFLEKWFTPCECGTNLDNC